VVLRVVLVPRDSSKLLQGEGVSMLAT